MISPTTCLLNAKCWGSLAEELCHEAFASEFVPLIRAKGVERIEEGRDSGAAQTVERGKRGVEGGKEARGHTSAVPFNLRGNIFGARWLSSGGVL